MGFPVRDRGFGGLTPFTVTPGVKWLLIVNIGLFVVSYLFADSLLGPMLRPLALTPFDVLFSFAFWQPVTYMFLHSTSGFGHILMNMLSLWMFGSTLEQTWGTRRFLRYYFACGIGAAVCIILVNSLAGMGGRPTVGASGAVYGLLLAFGVLFPRTVVLFMFIFPMQARWMVMIIGGMVFLSSVGEFGGPVSHIGHLGGMLTGLVLLRSAWMKRRGGPSVSFDPLGMMRKAYSDWKFQRAKKKFQVYLREQDTDSRNRRDDRNRWVQ